MPPKNATIAINDEFSLPNYVWLLLGFPFRPGYVYQALEETRGDATLFPLPAPAPEQHSRDSVASTRVLQGGPLLVINGLITPINGCING